MLALVGARHIVHVCRVRVNIHSMEREEIHEEFWYGNLNERDQMKNLGVDGRIILKYITKK